MNDVYKEFQKGAGIPVLADSKAYPKFTADMKETHTILFPQMAPIHFAMLGAAFQLDGYNTVVLENGGPEVAQEGLKYVHNDTCYPALLVIGQFIDALKSGKYDLERTALLITQTGGGCRASNYIHLLRKALRKSGFGNVPVLSLNFSGLEKDTSLKFTIPLIRRAVAALFYGDQLMSLANQLRPYENNKGSVDALIEKWQKNIIQQFKQHRGVSTRDMKKNFAAIAKDYAEVDVTKVPKVKVGIVGEIYVKYSPLGNSDLEAFLASEDCEVNMPGLLGFIQYSIVNGIVDRDLYGGNKIVRHIYKMVLDYTTRIEKLMIASIKKYPNLNAPGLFEHTMSLHKGFIGLGAKMGEGWLLTSEMVELVKSGYPNIVCAQPFGCLPNHIVGKGMISKIRAEFPEANITPIDYDPSATKVNQENRIKLMIAVAKERLEENAISQN